MNKRLLHCDAEAICVIGCNYALLSHAFDLPRTRPSGIPIIPDREAVITQEVSELDGRGRLHLLPRWVKRVHWLATRKDREVIALMVMVEPGLVSLRNWEPDGPRIVARYNELARVADSSDLEPLRSLQDRYQRLPIPKDMRPHLGDAALVNLGVKAARGAKANVYVAISSHKIDILGQLYRNAKLVEGHAVLDDLP